MDEDDLTARAGEYVLGLLEGGDLARAEALRATDTGFARAVKSWELSLLPLTAEVPEIAPPPHLWNKINSMTKPSRSRAYSGQPRVGFGLALGALAIVALVFCLRPETGQPVGGFNTTYGAIEVEANASDIIVHPQNFFGPSDKSVELWMIAGNQPPQPMGLATTFARFSARRPPAGEQVIIAASLEPEGGSPTGLPTGPVIGEVSLTGL